MLHHREKTKENREKISDFSLPWMLTILNSILFSSLFFNFETYSYFGRSLRHRTVHTIQPHAERHQPTAPNSTDRTCQRRCDWRSAPKTYRPTAVNQNIFMELFVPSCFHVAKACNFPIWFGNCLLEPELKICHALVAIRFFWWEPSTGCMACDWKIWSRMINKKEIWVNMTLVLEM